MTAVKLNDITLPPRLVKELDLKTLKSITDQDEVTFYEFFQGLDLPDVRNSHSSLNMRGILIS